MAGAANGAGQGSLQDLTVHLSPRVPVRSQSALCLELLTAPGSMYPTPTTVAHATPASWPSERTRDASRARCVPDQDLTSVAMPRTPKATDRSYERREALRRVVRLATSLCSLTLPHLPVPLLRFKARTPHTLSSIVVKQNSQSFRRPVGGPPLLAGLEPNWAYEVISGNHPGGLPL